MLIHRGVGIGMRVWWIRGKGPSTAVGVSPILLWQLPPAHLPLPLSHPLSTVQAPSILSQPHLWCQIDSRRNPQLLAVFFQLCYSVSIFILWFLTSREKQKELFFPLCPAGGWADSEQYEMILPGAEVLLSSYPSLCSFGGLDGLSISFPVSRILYYLGSMGEGKKRK